MTTALDECSPARSGVEREGLGLASPGA
jgi:hypothetical protein